MKAPAFLSAHLARSPAVATIPAGADFLRELIAPIVEAYKDDPIGLSRLTLFLPNRRAIRTAGQLFGDLGEGEVTLLPRLRALGDLDEEDLIISGQPPAAALELKPSADPVTRRLQLAHLVRAKEIAQDRGADWLSAIRTGELLGRFLDGLHRDDVHYSQLETFSSGDLEGDVAKHWAEQLDFLSILGSAWPQILEAQGWMEGAERRTAILNELGEVLLHAPQDPVIVAGSLGTVKATSRFMARVAMSEAGVVILPGFEPEMDTEAWEAIEAPHPQAIFRGWLKNDLDDLPRKCVLPWTEEKDTLRPRRAFLSLALRPANATDSWYDGFAALQDAGELRAACEGLRLLAAESPDEEAALISLLLREALNVPDRTAMLVTPDRDLARRVCAKLRAWSIDVDDTGGTPLGGTFRGTFMRAVAAWLGDPSSGAALMQILNHELCQWGQDLDTARQSARRIDLELRGVKYPCWADLISGVSPRLGEKLPAALPLLDLLSSHLDQFVAAGTLAQQISVMTDLAEQLSATDKEEGVTRLWRYEDGELLSSTIDGLLTSPVLPQDPAGTNFADLFEALLGSAVVRRVGVGHPRLFVYGLVEARLQTADLTILAGLNEGVWPDAAPEDPFLSRQMRVSLGLAAPEQSIGRAAHDFEQHAARPDVVLSRSMRQGRSPASASRWWVRIESFLRAGGLQKDVDITDSLRALRAIREAPPASEIAHAPPPEPVPPKSAMPPELSVTAIGRLMRDPYAIYARQVLKLKHLQPLDMPVGYAERGNVYHDLYQALGEEPGVWEARGEDLLVEVFRKYRIPMDYLVFWRRDTARALANWQVLLESLTPELSESWFEETGLWTLKLPSGEMRLNGRADRIDRCQDGLLNIIDYKTGVPPTMRQDLAFDPQLSILALMARAGAFEKFEAAGTHRIAYLPILKELDAPIFGDLKADGRDYKSELWGQELADHIEEVDRRLRELLEAMLSGERPFRSQIYPKKAADTGDYDLLARRGEWAVRGDDGGTENGD
ncbi:double-strand break repair protein AddB [Parvularcula marina]|uniref:double-strand break repair protein AddB n=1 Tax=Parvularcula marina TaxID=2292771 RepID=UPI003512E020